MNNPNNENEQSANELAPTTWRDWSPGRSVEQIHTDSVEKIIVLLAQTSDVEPDNSHTVDYFEDLLFGNEIGSMNHYYAENSRGQVAVEGEVVGWIQLSKSLTDYDEDTLAGGEYGIQAGIREALTLADNSVDYSLYDQNNDGSIDNLMVVFVGESDASNGDSDGDGEKEDADAIWPMQWSLQTPFTTNDGVSARQFFVCTEDCGMGIFVHEFAHNLGLPDLYDNDYSSAGTGFWSMMGGGAYSNAHFDAWSKYKFGWIEPTIVQPDTLAMELTLYPVETTGTIVKVPISNTEYWLIEYRSNSAGDYDEALPGSGVLIWHIDESVTDAWGRVDNDNEDHPAVKLIQADGNGDLENNRNGGDSGDYFLSNSIFNNRSNPAALTWSGTDVGLSVSVTNIDENSDTATLAFSRGSAWFSDIDWAWEDTIGDGFQNQVTFYYDINSIESDLGVVVELELYGADNHQYLSSINRTHTVSYESFDEFEFSIGYYIDPASGIFEIKALLWVGEDLVDVYTPAYPIWFENPEASNAYDERFETITFEFIDKDGDGNDETVRGYYEIASDDPDSPTVELELICFNQNDPNLKATEVQENLASNNFSSSHGLSTIGIIEIDLSSYDLQPGIIDVWAVISIDGEREEVFALAGTELWWNKLYIEVEEIVLRDVDFDGFDDWLEFNLQFDHTWRTNDTIELEFNLYDQSTLSSSPIMISQKEYTLFVGPRTHDSSGGRDIISNSFSGISGPSSSTGVALQLVMTYPDGSTEHVWYPSEYDSYLLSPTDRDGDGIIDVNDPFPDNRLEWNDSDGDGVGDNSDVFPNNLDEWLDSDADGVGDNSDMCPNTWRIDSINNQGCMVNSDVSFIESDLATNLLLVFCILPIFLGALLIVVVIKFRRKSNFDPVQNWYIPPSDIGHIHAEKTPYSTQLETQQSQNQRLSSIEPEPHEQTEMVEEAMNVDEKSVPAIQPEKPAANLSGVADGKGYEWITQDDGVAWFRIENSDSEWELFEA